MPRQLSSNIYSFVTFSGPAQASVLHCRFRLPPGLQPVPPTPGRGRGGWPRGHRRGQPRSHPGPGRPRLHLTVTMLAFRPPQNAKHPTGNTDLPKIIQTSSKSS